MLERIVSCDGYVNFIIQVTELTDHYLDADVYEVTSWNAEDNTPCDKDKYCKAYMKWDGCCHVWFGEEDETGKSDGYMHLCGVDSWKKHILLMEELYKCAEENINSFDDSERWD